MVKVVIFGANGFIGRNLINKLAENGEYSITAFDRFSSYRMGTNLPFSDSQNVNVIAGDFLNQSDIRSAVKGSEHVIHLISTTSPANSDLDPLIDIDTNIRGTVALLQICVEEGVRQVTFSSSGGAVYGNIDSQSIDELTMPLPRSPYAIGKLTIENYLRYFKYKHNLDYVIYRIANPYGPGQRIIGKQGVVAIFMHKLLENKPINILGDGEMVRDYFYIDDLVNMISNTFCKHHTHKEYNLGSGKGTSVNTLISLIEECAEISFLKTYLLQPSTYIQNNVLNIERFVNEFNLPPSTPLDRGISLTWEYVKSNF